MNTSKFKTNINCGNCLKTVSPFINELDNIDLWKVDFDNPDKILEVEFDEEGKNNIAEVIAAVGAAGFNIEILGSAKNISE